MPLGHRTRRRKLHHKAARRNDDKAPHGGFGGPEDAQRGAVKGAREPSHRGSARKPQHGEQGFNDAPERFTVAFDGPGPVQCVSYPAYRTKQEHK